MKLVISRIALFILLILLYTYLIAYFTTIKMIKNEAIYSITKDILLQEMIKNNNGTDIENVLNSNIKTDIALYEAYEQNISIFSNPKDLYFLLTDFNSKNIFCHNDILKYSKNPDAISFLKRNCKEK